MQCSSIWADKATALLKITMLCAYPKKSHFLPLQSSVTSPFIICFQFSFIASFLYCYSCHKLPGRQWLGRTHNYRVAICSGGQKSGIDSLSYIMVFMELHSWRIWGCLCLCFFCLLLGSWLPSICSTSETVWSFTRSHPEIFLPTFSISTTLTMTLGSPGKF